MTLKTDHERLRLFCETHAQDKRLVLDAFEFLGPFIKIADSGLYPLRHEADFDAMEMASAISDAVLRDVDAVRFISIAHAIDDAEREIGNRERNGLWFALERMLSEALWARSNVTMWGPLKKPIKEHSKIILGNVLYDTVEETLGDPLSESIRKTLGVAGFGPKLRTRIPKNVVQAIFYFIGFAVGGNRGRLDAMKPLMHCMLGSIPIGERLDPSIDKFARDRGSCEWLVLVA